MEESPSRNSKMSSRVNNLNLILAEDEAYRNVNDSYWEKMIAEVDNNNDGEIDYNEFIDMMN